MTEEEIDRYSRIKDTINNMALMEYGESYDYGIHPKTAEKALKHLNELKQDEVPSPLLFPDNEGGLHFVWTLADWKLYRTFSEDADFEDYIIPGKNSVIVDRRGAFGGSTLPKLKYTVIEE